MDTEFHMEFWDLYSYIRNREKDLWVSHTVCSSSQMANLRPLWVLGGWFLFPQAAPSEYIKLCHCFEPALGDSILFVSETISENKC